MDGLSSSVPPREGGLSNKSSNSAIKRLPIPLFCAKAGHSQISITRLDWSILECQMQMLFIIEGMA